MKNLTSFALAIALCAACAVSAFAADAASGVANATSGTTTITTNIQPSYTVKIPAATKIDFNDTVTNLCGTLHLETAQLEPNHNVTISAKPTALKNDKDNSEIPFTLYKGNTPFTAAYLTDTTEKVQLSVHITKDAWSKASAGNYTGSVTFTITYASKGG